jgi:acetyltransferase-like isoleucine patch superfamily enzyme
MAKERRISNVECSHFLVPKLCLGTHREKLCFSSVYGLEAELLDRRSQAELGNARTRRSLRSRCIVNLGDCYHPDSTLQAAGFRRLGRNVKIHARASIYGTENITLGDDARIDDFAILIATGPVEIGAHVSIPNFCFLGARNGITLEDFVTLAPGVKIFTASDDYHGDKMTGPTVPADLTGGKAGPVLLKRHCIIGAGSVILPGCTLGEGCAVGALSLVARDLPAWGIYAGVPARRIKERRRDLLKLEAAWSVRQAKAS